MNSIKSGLGRVFFAGLDFILNFLSGLGSSAGAIISAVSKKISQEVSSRWGRILTRFVSGLKRRAKGAAGLLYSMFDLRDGINQAFSAAKSEKVRGGFFDSVYVFFVKFFKAIFRGGYVFTTFFNYIAPIVAVSILISVITDAGVGTYALEVKYNDEVIGYISGEEVFETASERVASILQGEDDKSVLIYLPEYKLKSVSYNEIMDAAALSDILVKKSGALFTGSCGLFVDGEYLGSLSNESDLRSLLDEILVKFQVGVDDATVSFNNDIEIRYGLYPISKIKTVKEMNAVLLGLPSSGEDISSVIENSADGFFSGDNGNSLLSIKVTRREVYPVGVPYNTKTVQDSNQYVGYERIKTVGIDGEAEVTALVSYVDGLVTERRELSRKITLQAQEEIIVQGTRIPTKAESLAATVNGKFSWPVTTGYVSSGFHTPSRPGHNAIDIAAPYGTPIYAAASGKVTHSGWSTGGAGLNILVDCGSGYVTQYAHCSVLYANEGQYVIKGQIIALVGRTGNATGNHLHFSISYNGSYVDPRPFLE